MAPKFKTMESKSLLLLSKEDLQATIQDIVTETLNDSKPDLVRINEASEILGISIPALYTLVHRGQIPYHKVQKYLYFSRKELTRWITGGGEIVKNDN